MGLSKDQIRQWLTRVPHPEGGDLVARGCVVGVAACDQHASIKLSLVSGPKDPDPSPETMQSLARKVEQVVKAAAMASGEEQVVLGVEFINHAGKTVARFGAGEPPASEPRQAAQPTQQASASGIDGVRHIIAVGAGKGGVGKSTVSVNLAVGLARQGHAVGLLDGDIYGPSLPTMLGLDALDQTVLDGALQPFHVHGVKAVTMGKLVDPEKPLIWRGPMAHGAFTQLTERTSWGELDYLVIDLPPGTGDVPLTMAQSLKLTGAVIVCTPQKVAQDDAVRAAKMFQQLGVEVLGVVENMSFFIGDDGKEYDIFGRGGAEKMAQRLGLPFLGSVPINMALRKNSDSGDPLGNFDPAAAGGPALPKALETLVRNLEGQVNLASLKQGKSRPSLTVR
ncbi:MAG: Mrp/NBP35 family ATP-binding protein [Phycisphaerales bacterium]|nr:Mrp/NBP35 family ATP-binding protein [Phycisphaerales bacterium]